MSNTTFWSQNQINFAALEDEYNFTANQHQPHIFSYPQQHDQYQPQLATSSLQEAFGLNQSQQQQPIQHPSSFGGPQASFSPHRAPTLPSSVSTAGASSSYRPLPIPSGTYDLELPHQQLPQRFGTPSSALLGINFSPPPNHSPIQKNTLKRSREDPPPDDRSSEQPPSDQKDGKAKLYVKYSSTPIYCTDILQSTSLCSL